MKQVEIKNKQSQLITHAAKFDTQELADAWIDKQIAKGANCAWGRPAYTEQVVTEVESQEPALDELGEPMLDEQGEPVLRTVYTEQVDTVEHEAEFEVIVTDLGDAHLLAAIRAKRDALLAASDFAMLSDAPLSEAKKAEYAQYRQALRDLPSTVDVAAPVYPTKPE